MAMSDDDPSGIMQQMPEGGDEALTKIVKRLRGQSPIPSRDEVADAIVKAVAHLRADVERLRANAKGMRALLRAGCDLLSLESEALRNSVSIIGEPERLSDDPEDAPTIAAITEIEDWIASVKATLFPPALSTITDGGQDDAIAAITSPPAATAPRIADVAALGLALIEQDGLGGKAGWDAFVTALRALEGQG